jgi:hypothetical protein
MSYQKFAGHSNEEIADAFILPRKLTLQQETEAAPSNLWRQGRKGNRK